MNSANSEPKLYARVEGGAVYTKEESGQFLVILNQTALFDLLDASELADIAEPAEKVWSFATAAERDLYLAARFKHLNCNEHAPD